MCIILPRRKYFHSYFHITMSKKPKVFKGKKMKLYNVPEDVQQIIIDKLEEEKINCKCERSQDYAIYKMLRQYNDLMCCELMVAFNGQILKPAPDIIFEGDRITVSLKVPLSTPLGMALNYKRIESSEASGKKKAE